MNYKFLSLMLILSVLMSVSFVFAEEQVSIEDVKFNIPSGFEEHKLSLNGTDDVNQSNDYGEFKWFLNKDTEDMFMIQVGVLEDINLSDDDAIIFLNSSSDVEQKTIQEKEGYLFPYGDMIGFGYVEDGKLIQLRSSNETFFEEIIANSTA